MAASPLRPARFLFLFFPPPLSIGSYQSTEGGEGGKEPSTLSKGRNLKGEVKREGGLGKCLYFPFCGGYDS